MICRLTIEQKPKIIKLYLSGMSADQVRLALNIATTTRSIQRYLKRQGVIRTGADGFRLAVNQGRVTYHKLSPEKKKKRKTVGYAKRYRVYVRDNHRCVMCGATALTDLLTVDHIDENPTNNEIDNLQVLCQSCNRGKYLSTLK